MHSEFDFSFLEINLLILNVLFFWPWCFVKHAYQFGYTLYYYITLLLPSRVN